MKYFAIIYYLVNPQGELTQQFQTWQFHSYQGCVEYAWQYEPAPGYSLDQVECEPR